MSNKTLYEYRVINDESITKGEVLVDSDQVDPQQTARDLAIANFVSDNPDTTITDVEIVVRPFLESVTQNAPAIFAGTWTFWQNGEKVPIPAWVSLPEWGTYWDEQRKKLPEQDPWPDITNMDPDLSRLLAEEVAHRVEQKEWQRGLEEGTQPLFSVGTRVKWNPAAFTIDTPHNRLLASKRGEVISATGDLLRVQWDGQSAIPDATYMSAVDLVLANEDPLDGVIVAGSRVLYRYSNGTNTRYFYGKVKYFVGVGRAVVAWEGCERNDVPSHAVQTESRMEWSSSVPVDQLELL